jgi:pimeloyl-ACP methyl ester carboxylesterase
MISAMIRLSFLCSVACFTALFHLPAHVPQASVRASVQPNEWSQQILAASAFFRPERPERPDSVVRPDKPKPIAETIEPYIFPIKFAKLRSATIAYIDEDSTRTANSPQGVSKAGETIVEEEPAAPQRRYTSRRGSKKRSYKSSGRGSKRSYSKRSSSKSSSSSQAAAGASSGKETLIFIHGLGGYVPIWNKQIRELRKNYRCIALDLPGYGRSSKSSQYTVSIFAYADVIIKFMDALKIQKATLVGHSMGGQIAFNLAMRYARRITRVAVVSSTGVEPFTEQERRAFHDNVTESTTKLKTDEQIRADHNRLFFKVPADADFFLADRLAMKYSTDFDTYASVVKNSIFGVIDMPTYDMLENISQNVLVIYGQNDNYIPNPFFHASQRANEVGEFAKSRLRHGKLMVLPKCGHFAQYEQPEAVNKALLDFIR